MNNEQAIRYKTTLYNIVNYGKLNVVMNPDYEKMYHEVVTMANEGYYSAMELKDDKHE